MGGAAGAVCRCAERRSRRERATAHRRKKEKRDMALLKERLKNGEQVLGTMVTAFAKRILRKIPQSCGLDFFIVDCEHGAFTTREAANIIAVARAASYAWRWCGYPDAPSTRSNSWRWVRPGCFLPNTEKRMRRGVADCTKYAPMGRAFSLLVRIRILKERRTGIYAPAKETILMCQIESPQGTWRTSAESWRWKLSTSPNTSARTI